MLAVAWLSSSGVAIRPVGLGSARDGCGPPKPTSLRVELDAAAPSDPEQMFQDMNWG